MTDKIKEPKYFISVRFGKDQSLLGGYTFTVEDDLDGDRLLRIIMGELISKALNEARANYFKLLEGEK